jgi:hypothetical protein
MIICTNDKLTTESVIAFSLEMKVLMLPLIMADILITCITIDNVCNFAF